MDFLKFILLPLFLMFLAMTFTLFFLGNGGNSKTAGMENYASSPPFSLALVNKEGEAKVSGQKDITIVLFVATWSEQSIDQLAILEGYLAESKLSGKLDAFVIDSGEKKEVFLNTLRRGGYVTPSAVDSSGALANAFGVTSVPTLFLLDRAGRIIDKETKVIGSKDLGDKIEKILSDTRL